MDDFEAIAIKLVVAGPVGAGKTTAIHSISESEPVSTEMPLSEMSMGEKTTTTVAFDFSTVMLDDHTPLFIYGLPGQRRFEHMWPIILEGAIGVVLVLDGCDPEVESHCHEWINSLMGIDETLPIVIGVTKTDIGAAVNLRSLRAALCKSGYILPVFSFDARNPEQTRHLIRALLVSME